MTNIQIAQLNTIKSFHNNPEVLTRVMIQEVVDAGLIKWPYWITDHKWGYVIKRGVWTCPDPANPPKINTPVDNPNIDPAFEPPIAPIVPEVECEAMSEQVTVSIPEVEPILDFVAAELEAPVIPTLNETISAETLPISAYYAVNPNGKEISIKGSFTSAHAAAEALIAQLKCAKKGASWVSCDRIYSK